jgi:hypothetical protein
VGQRSKVTQLPAEVRAWLDVTLAEKNFGGYKLIVAELARRGFVLSKSSVHRYGANLEHKLEAIRASTEAARQIASMSPDDADQRSAAVMSMLQTEIFNVLIGAKALNDERDPGKKVKILSSLSANVAKLARASIHQKKHELEIRSKAHSAADAAAKIAQRGGLSKGAVEQIRSQILGIAT